MRRSRLLALTAVSAVLASSPTPAWANNGVGVQATVGVGFAYLFAALILVLTGSLPRPAGANSGPRLTGVFLWTPILVFACSVFQFGATVYLIPIVLIVLVGRLSYFAIRWGQARTVGRPPYEGSRSSAKGAVQVLGGFLALGVLPLSFLLLGVGSRDVWVEHFQGRTAPRALYILADVQERAFAETGAYLEADAPAIQEVLSSWERGDGPYGRQQWTAELSLGPVTPGYRIILRSTHRAPALLGWVYSDHALCIGMDENRITRLAASRDATWSELQEVGTLGDLGTWFLERAVGD